MQAFIDGKIQSVHQDFVTGLRSVKGLCELKTLTYEGGKLPDYSRPIIQQFYLLRYFPAYLAEYYLIYHALLSRFGFADRPLNILSIGAGCGIDYWGLKFAADACNVSCKGNLRYTGIDIVEWGYRDSMGHDEVWFPKQDIADWDALDEEEYNVIVFPKSIGEFDAKLFGHVRDIFASTWFVNDTVALVCSLRDKSKEADAERVRQIVETMRDAHGFECLDDANSYWTYKDQGIRKVCPEFVYPNSLIDDVSNILRYCPTFQRKRQACREDCQNLNRKPILRTAYMKWQILRLQRS